VEAIGERTRDQLGRTLKAALLCPIFRIANWPYQLCHDSGVYISFTIRSLPGIAPFPGLDKILTGLWNGRVEVLIPW
jgi:hypothetical protein